MMAGFLNVETQTVPKWERGAPHDRHGLEAAAPCGVTRSAVPAASRQNCMAPATRRIALSFGVATFLSDLAMLGRFARFAGPT
jgi:hypothetical protein